MKVEFIEGTEVGTLLVSLLDGHDEAHWAVAWGALTPLAKQILSRWRKMRSVTFGLAFSHTDPDLVDALQGLDGCRVVTRFPKGTYHPKVYAFRSGNRVAAIVGSANFTPGGLGVNHEASVLITGTTADPVLSDILGFTARSARLGVPVTAELARRYRLRCEAEARRGRPARDPLGGGSVLGGKALESPLIDMSWTRYAAAVRGSAIHDVPGSLAVLRTIQGWLSMNAFGDLASERRKAIGGYLSQAQGALISDELDQDWGRFGSMRGAGDFMNRIDENDPWLARAVDGIPHKGVVERAHYDRFVDQFTKAFENSSRSGDVSTATRLLAMKRPDIFLCISKPNRVEAAASMGFAKSTLKLHNYWDRVIEVIRASRWYNAAKPAGRDGQMWEFRAAMLDSIFYRPLARDDDAGR